MRVSRAGSTNIALFVFLLQATVLHAQEGIYYLTGEDRIYLEAMENVRAYKIPEELSAAEVDAVLERSSGQLDLPRLREQYRIEVFKRPDETSEEIFERTNTILGERFGPDSEVPVFRVGGTMLLFTGTFTVEYARGLSEEFSIERDLSEVVKRLLPSGSGANVVRDERRQGRQRYKVSFDELDPIQALNLINSLTDLPEIRGAFPDFIRITEYKLLQGLLKPSAPKHQLAIDSQCARAAIGDPPTDTLFDRQWALHNQAPFIPQWIVNWICFSNVEDGYCDADIDWLEAWTSYLQNADYDDVLVAVVDLGVDEHNDLRLIIPGINATNTGDWMIQNGSNHGTSVAGIAAAEVDNCRGVAGVSPFSQTLSVRISEVNEDGVWLSFADEAGDGLLMAAEAGAKVLVNSWFIDADDPDVRIVIRDIIDDFDVLIVAAAGNVGLLNDDCTYQLSTNRWSCEAAVKFPAKLAGDVDVCTSGAVVAVSASNQRDEFKTVELYEDAPPSGPSTAGDGDWGSAHGVEISVAAPGSNIVTTDNGNQYQFLWYGTSASAPFVGGVAAVLRAMYPEADAYQIKQWLQSGADPGPGDLPVPNEYFGFGRLNANNTIKLATLQMNLGSSGTERPPECGDF